MRGVGQLLAKSEKEASLGKYSALSSTEVLVHLIRRRESTDISEGNQYKPMVGDFLGSF